MDSSRDVWVTVSELIEPLPSINEVTIYGKKHKDRLTDKFE